MSRIWHKVNFKRSLTGLNSEFSFAKTSWHTKVKNPNLLQYLPIAGREIVGFILFLRVLALYKMQATWFAKSISYDDIKVYL